MDEISIFLINLANFQGGDNSEQEGANDIKYLFVVMPMQMPNDLFEIVLHQIYDE